MSACPGVLITGGAKRVGAELTRYFARNGYDIALHYHQSQSEALALQKEVREWGGTCEVFALNLADAPHIPAFMESVQRSMPQVEVLINNASVFERATFMETDEALFDRQCDVNFKAPFFLTQAFARVFGKGVVINVADTDVVQTHGSHFAYLLSKKMLVELTVMAARALGPAVRVNGMCPGLLIPGGPEEALYEKKLEATLPLQANATPQALAQAAYWLASQPHITGQLLFIDGGKHVL